MPTDNGLVLRPLSRVMNVAAPVPRSRRLFRASLSSRQVLDLTRVTKPTKFTLHHPLEISYAVLPARGKEVCEDSLGMVLEPQFFQMTLGDAFGQFQESGRHLEASHPSRFLVHTFNRHAHEDPHAVLQSVNQRIIRDMIPPLQTDEHIGSTAINLRYFSVDKRIHVHGVGDSGALLLSTDGKIKKRTQEENVFSKQMKRMWIFGKKRRQLLGFHPHQHKHSNILGQHPMTVHEDIWQVKSGDILLAYTDGYADMVEELYFGKKSLARYTRGFQDIEDLRERLLQPCIKFQERHAEFFERYQDLLTDGSIVLEKIYSPPSQTWLRDNAAYLEMVEKMGLKMMPKNDDLTLVCIRIP